MIGSAHLQAAAGLGITAIGELVLLSQSPSGQDLNSVTSGTPGLWFAIGGIITALGTTIIQPWFKERGTEAKLADALKRLDEASRRADEANQRIESLEASRTADAAEKQKTLDLMAHVTERNIGLTKLLERLTTAELVRAGRHMAGVPIQSPEAPLWIADGPPQPTGPSVLLVEDDPPARLSATIQLEMRNYRVEAVGGLADALEALDRDPDFVMLDLMLPDGDGLDLLRKIRDEGRKTQVIVTTGRDKALWDAVTALAPLAVLGKPYDLNAIFALMKAKAAS